MGWKPFMVKTLVLAANIFFLLYLFLLIFYISEILYGNLKMIFSSMYLLQDNW